MSTPANKYLTASHRVRGGSVIVARGELVASLIFLCMQDFDVILRMDWLGENRPLIDCKARKVTFRPPDRREGHANANTRNHYLGTYL